jgi:serine protease DegQ
VRMRVRGGVVLVLAVLTVGLASGCTGSGPSGGGTSSSGSGSSSSSTAAVGGSNGSAASGGLEQVPGVVAKLEPSVVTVLVSGGVGSGVVYTADGLILTNEHVVRGNRTVRVAFADGQQVSGTVKATDAVTDLALVQAGRRGLPPAKFQTRLPQVGSLAVVLGSPLGFQNTVTAGVISGLHREIPGSAAQGQSLVDLVQTDAPISPGNSGGALANAQGEVVGISEAYIPPQAGAVSLGFAIPAATAVDIAEQLRRSGQARHAFAGLVPAAITPEIASELGLSSTEGAIVAQVSPGGPAERVGLRPGDVITAVDGQPTRTPEDFLAALRPHKPGDTLRLTVHTPGSPDRIVDLTVTDRPS